MSLFVYREPVPERVLPTADESVVVASGTAQPLVSLTTNANSSCALDVDWRIALEFRPRRTHCVFRELYRVDPALHLPFLPDYSLPRALRKASARVPLPHRIAAH
jgi:hypothetical protein